MLDKKDINILKGTVKDSEVLKPADLQNLFDHIDLLESLLDQTDDGDFIGFGLDGWRDFAENGG